MSIFDNPEDWVFTNTKTGEVLSLDIYITEATCNGWQKAYVKPIAEVIECSGHAGANVIAWILKNKDQGNLVLGTYDEIAKESEAGKSTVQKVFKRMIDKGYLVRIRNGCHMLDPKVIRYGSKGAGAALLTLWDKATEESK